MLELTVDRIIDQINFANQEESGLGLEYAKELLTKLTKIDPLTDSDKKRMAAVHDYLTVEIEDLEKLKKIKDFGNNIPKCCGITAEYSNPYGKSNNHSLDIEVESFHMVISYYDGCKDKKRYINTCLYHVIGNRYRHFVIGKGKCPDIFPNLKRVHNGSHSIAVNPDEWMDEMLRIANAVVSHKDDFIVMCKGSSPFNDDGTHRFKNWKTSAKLEITSLSENQLLQGFKNGSTPSECRYTGSNGSFVAFSQKYILRVTLKCLSGEKPINDYIYDVDMDKYFRTLRDKLGRKKLPYECLNSMLPQDVEVITTDMEEDSEYRAFYPISNGGSWEKLLIDAFEEL